ncbi:MAG: gliding motility-associated C-terminal domain-containing protein [Bacteroidales bacterium]|nr:gliding motility-associated C-terminal domain-containing protein [Bacteroidales bacterium]
MEEKTGSTTINRQRFGHLVWFALWMLVANIATPQIPTAGLVGYWPFNGNANDMSGNGNHGILECESNNPQLTTDRFGNANSAYQFGGYYNKNWIRVPNNSTMLLTDQMTISLWFQQCVFAGMDGWGSFSTTEAGFSVFTKAGDGIAAYPGIFIGSGINSQTGKLSVSSANTNGHPSSDMNYEIRTEYNCFDTCEWVHFVSIVDDTIAKIYLNGVLYIDTIINHADYTQANLHDLFIGRMGCEGFIWYPFNGKIDDVAFYNRAISENEVAQLFGHFYDEHAFDNIITIDSLVVTNACNGNDGMVQIFPDTLNAPYQYALDYASNFQSSNIIQNISPGTHRIYIKSACGLKDTLIDFTCCQNPPVILHSPDTTIQFGDSATLWASGADVLYWTDASGNILASGPTLTVSPTTTTMYYITGQNFDADLSSNLVVNGDFEQGNVGFITDYMYSNDMYYGRYYITTDGILVWGSDHLYGYGGTGQFMVVDGATTPNSIVWQQTVPVTPNTYYAFSAQVASTLNSNSANSWALLQFSVNGIQLGPIFHSPNVLNIWQPYYEVWFSGNNTSATLTILNQNENGAGNDFGLDDIVFAPVATCSATDFVYVHLPEFPDNVDSATCTFLPEGTEWGVHVDWSSNSIVSNLNSPLVGDLDNDGHPDVLCFSLNGQTSNTEHWGQGNLDNEMLVFDGVTKQLKATITMESPVSAYDAASYGLVRTSNGKGLIVTANYDYKLRAYDITSPTPSTPYWVSDVDYGADPEEFAVNVSFADFNGDGHPEVYVRNKVYNAETGKLLATVPTTNTGSSFAHYTHNTHRKLSAPMTADLSGNGLPELILGNEIYTVSLTNPNGTAGNTATLWMQTTPPAPVPVDGHAQVADFDMDGHLDVFISIRNTDMHSGTVYCYVWDVYNNTMSQPLSINTSFSGKSIPLIADIDNDGSMEMVIQCAVTNSNNKIQAYKYNAASRTFSMIWGMQPDEDSYSNSFTAFDFNLDGLLELIICDQSTLRIVNGSGKSHLTHNDTVPVYVLNSFPFSETTIMQYPVIADADADGSAEIVSVGSSQLNILKSTTQPWAPARKVWNQYMYNVTNINEDLTVPLHLFNNATPFTDPDNVVRRPFNNFLQQATSIDLYGRPFYAVPDVTVNNASTQIVGDTLLLSFSYCNLGDNTLNAPYPVMVFLNTYGGDTLCTALVNNSLPKDSCVQNEIHLSLSALCNLPVVDSLIFAVNGNSLGIAQNGGLQPECDTTNNTTSVAIHIVPQTDTNYIVVHACDTLTWNGVTYDTSGVYIRTLANMYGCDSVVVMDLTVDPSSLTLFSDSVCQNSTYNGHGFSLSEDETSESGLSTFDRTLSNQFGCDSVIRLNLYVKPIVTPDFYANPDKAMLSENPVINFVNNTDIVELAQANYYWVWDFGDGVSDTTSEAENSHLYTNWGDYTVTLTLWADGCIDTASVTVIIEADLEFPNVITPNGDGINDVFVIKNLNPDRPNKLYISDRWGKVVWNKENYKTYMKDEQIYNAESGFGMGNISDGVYYFSFYYEGVVRTIKFNGSITVIR